MVKAGSGRLGYHDNVIVRLTQENNTDDTLYALGQALASIPQYLEAYLVSGN